MGEESLIDRAEADKAFAPDDANTFIKFLYSRESEARLAGAASRSVYDKKFTHPSGPLPKYDKVPYCLYLYYVRIDTDGKLKVSHYFYDSPTEIVYSDVPALVQGLIDDLRSVNPTLEEKGRNFENIKWERVSYIAFFVDEENWTLHQEGSVFDGISFDTKGGTKQPNHTFFDAKDLAITVTNRTTGRVSQRSAIFFVNHMKKDNNGTQLGRPGVREEQEFKFEIVFDVQFAYASSKRMIAIFDPDGTNIGPPLPPPTPDP